MTDPLLLDSLPAELQAPVQRWWERASAMPGFPAIHRGLPHRVQSELGRVVACSEFIGALIIQDPAALEWFGTCEQGDAAQAATGVTGVTGVTGAQAASGADHDYARLIAHAPDTAQVSLLLREWRRRQMLRIAWRDLAGHAAVSETLEAVSQLADACIRAAHAAAARLLAPVFGLPRDGEQRCVPFIVLGMGKLGGVELNFSSDIDLIFLFAQEGQTDGPRSIDNQEYFDRLGRELIRLLDVRNEHGFVFRVDMRLRPFGDSGPLSVSLASLETYLQEHGRDWERYAWIKARPIIAAEAYEAAYREVVRPFVYRRYLDFGVFDALRGMKALIEREVARRELTQHLKLGSGGIREIEFIVQSLQLVRGGNDRRLQSSSLLQVLPLLEGSKLLPAGAVAQLRDAYWLLRRAENALQMMRDQQVHNLPENTVDQARLALALQEDGWPAAAARIDDARAKVAAHFAAVLFGASDEQRRHDDPGASWLDSDDARIEGELAQYGFPPSQLATVAAHVQLYRQAPPYRRLDDAGHRRLFVIVDRLLKSAARLSEPAVVLQRVLRVLEAIGARSSYLALLKEQPPALDRLIQVCAISGFLAQRIAEFPLLLDELLDARAFDQLPSRDSFAEELSARTERLATDDAERQVEALRQFQKIAVFKVALADLTDRLPLMRVSDRLTDIAELILQCCVSLAWQQMTATYGVPLCGEEEAGLRPAAVAVAGYGKLGGLELGYASDLDLVFLHDSSGTIQKTQGSRSIDNGVFFLRLGQRIVHLLTMHSAAGRLYQVDMRLRPNGKGGFLITGIESFALYQRQEAWTWEHQALLRARALAGDARLCGRFEDIRHDTLSAGLHADTLRADVAQMRQRMRRELSKAGAGQFDVKQDAGGIGDIEFLVQYWVLASAPTHPALLRYTDNIRQLEGLAEAGIIPPARAQWLIDAYVGYRTVLHHLSLEGGSDRVVEAAAHAATRLAVSEIWRDTFGA